MYTKHPHGENTSASPGDDTSLALTMPLHQRSEEVTHSLLLNWSDDMWDIEQHFQVGEQSGEESQDGKTPQKPSQIRTDEGYREERTGMGEKMVQIIFCVTPESKILTPVGKIIGN